jgi:sugar phosphate isomerase/epimerase
MQGRLTNFKLNKLAVYPKYPYTEIKAAKNLNLSHIEFITEENFNPKNLIWSDKKIKKFSNSLKKNNLKKISFIDNSSVKKNFSDNLGYYFWLINQISKAKFNMFLLPLIGSSELNLVNINTHIKSLNKLSDLCSKKKIDFAVETNVNYSFYKKFRKKVPKNFGLVFDTGNRYLKYKNKYSDILKFKREIKHIHLKDRDSNGKNVLLGKGKVNFKKFFKNLRLINFKGYYTLETTRDKDAKNSIIHNLNHLKNAVK